MSIAYPVHLDSLRRYVATAHGAPRPLTAREISILSRFAAACLDVIEEAWPVDTSLSRDAFDYDLYAGDYSGKGVVGFTIVNPVWYAEFVHPAGAGPTPLWTYLFPAVVQELAPTYLRLLQQAVDATEAEVRRGTPFVSVVARLNLGGA